MPSKKFVSFSRGVGEVDARRGIIYGVSVITEGIAKGHAVFIDPTTLKQVKLCAETYAGGLKVKMDHYSGVSETVGYLNNFRIEANKLLGDLHLFKSHEDFDFLIEMIETIPDTFGFSISFSGDDELIDNLPYARCSEIYSADIVDRPAANPEGLFEVPVDSMANDNAVKTKTKNLMTPEQLKALQDSLTAAMNLSIETALKPIGEKITALESKAAPVVAEPILPVTPTEEEKEKAMAEKIQAGVIKALAGTGVSAPVAPAPAAPIAPAAKVKTFEELVLEKVGEGKTNGQAIDLCVAQNKEAYRVYREETLGIKLI